MNDTLINARLFDDWVGRALAELRHVLLASRPTVAERDARHAVDLLRGRIRRYERQQPGYAADLRTALVQAERQLAALTAQRSA